MTNDTPDMTPVTAAPSVYKCNECGKVFDTDDPEKFHCHREPESKCCGMIYPVTTAPDWRGLVEELLPFVSGMQMQGGGLLNENGEEDGLKHVRYKCPICKNLTNISMQLSDAASKTILCTNPACPAVRARAAMEATK